jgi:hypothetical protein
MIDSGAFGSTVVNSESNDKVTHMIGTVINSMSKMENLTDEELEKEAKAIDNIMKIANASAPKKDTSEGGEPENPGEGGESGGDTINDLKNIFAGEGDNADEMVDVILSSKIASEAITEIAYDEEGNLNKDALEISESVNAEEKEAIIDSVEKYYKEAAAEKNNGEMTEEEIQEELETLKTNINAIAAIFGEDLTEELLKWDLEAAE